MLPDTTVSKYLLHDFEHGRGPTQSTIIYSKGTQFGRIRCNGLHFLLLVTSVTCFMYAEMFRLNRGQNYFLKNPIIGLFAYQDDQPFRVRLPTW